MPFIMGDDEIKFKSIHKFDSLSLDIELSNLIDQCAAYLTTLGNTHINITLTQASLNLT